MKQHKFGRSTCALLAMAIGCNLNAASNAANADATPATSSPATGEVSSVIAAPTPNPSDAASYNLGLTFGSQLHHGGLSTDVSLDALSRGIRDGLAGKQPSQADKQQASQFLMGARQVVGERNKQLAHEFLTKNASQPGIKSTPSGLQYLVLKAGDPQGAQPQADSQVTVTYRGKLLDGTEFDSSFTHGQAAIFRMNSMIPGWREALSMMRPGAKWRLFVPPELGYDLHTPASIPPGSLLVYELDLIRVNAANQFGPESNNKRGATLRPGLPTRANPSSAR